MGRTRDVKQEITTILAQLKRLDENFEDRMDEFSKDIQVSSAIKNKKKRILKLERLRDELSGYCTRIYQANQRAEGMYKRNSSPTKSLQELKEALERRFYNDEQEEHLKSLKECRDNSAHPNPYWIPVKFLGEAKNHLGLIKNAIQHLDSLNLTDQVSIRREVASQDSFIDRKVTSIQDIFNELNELLSVKRANE
ncbi:hypothetical protein D7Z26_16420 [Cohnella endophytica]|uniref:Uncharacterized protein n=1 Tax=Cohnella endophytica TaxID=2419778 RepID=A0A494XNS2_9BACL|nr:hypothetical protein [Cohnella endophytica]RKP51381.1 hypothetical protein D7Z26_16420 [Cohnella endophytica]